MKLIRWCIIIGLFLFGFYFKSEIMAVLMNKVSLDKPMLNAMLRCRVYPEKTTVISNPQGQKYTIPLPPRTIYLNNQTYLTSTINLKEYLTITLPGFGWTNVIRRGNMIHIKDKTGTREINITVYPYRAIFQKLEYSLTDMKVHKTG